MSDSESSASVDDSRISSEETTVSDDDETQQFKEVEDNVASEQESLHSADVSDCETNDYNYTNITENDNFDYLKYNNTGRGVRRVAHKQKKANRQQPEQQIDEEEEAQTDRKSREREQRSGKDRHGHRRSQRSPKKDKVGGMQLKPFPEGLNPSARRNEWILWREQFTLVLSLKRSLESEEEKRAFLIVSGGREIQKALNDRPSPDEITVKPIPVFVNALKRLDNHFKTGTNAITDIIRFRKLSQRKDEQFIDFVHRLKEHAAHCGFGDAEENEILIQIRTSATHADKLGEMMTRENKSLADVINYGSSLDNVETWTENSSKAKKEGRDPAIEDDVAAAYIPRQPSGGRNSHYGNRFRPYQENQRRQTQQRFPRRGTNNQNKQVCYNCKKPGHFIIDCRSRPSQSVAFANEDNKSVRNWMQ